MGSMRQVQGHNKKESGGGGSLLSGIKIEKGKEERGSPRYLTRKNKRGSP